MSDKRYFTRFAHNEGMTGLTFAEDGSCMLTCGSDGDVRVWKDLEDDDPKSHRVGESAFAVVLRKGRFFVSTDSNSVLAYTFPDSGPDGIVARSSALINHLDISNDGTSILVGSSDFSVKLVDIDNKSFKVLLGHDAPILSVALDPSMEYAASSSCDGSVRVWKIAKQHCIKSWASVFKASNELSSSMVLCRMSWQPVTGKFLAVPVANVVKIYKRDTWEEAFVLKDDSIKESINVVTFSKCGRYLATGCVDGTIAAWDMNSMKCLDKQKSDKSYSVCSIEWNPNGKGEIVFCDVQGRLGSVSDICLAQTKELESNTDVVAKEHSPEMTFLDDDLFADDDDDENTFSISKIKAETVGLEDFSDGTSLPNPVKVSVSRPVPDVVVPQGPKLAEPQDAFQPGSTPTYYSHRFMVWNSVGIVRSHNTEEENSIDVEFHDASVHHSLHLENVFGHTMADISTTAIVLSCTSQLDVPSKLVCMHFATWDSSKEWSIDMPQDVNIQAIAVSENWVVVATDERHLRLFSIGGVQREVFTIPGPVVALAASEDHLLVAYHRAIGYPGDQCLGVMIVKVSESKAVVASYDLPLSAKSTLSWLGFTDEGATCTTDSKGIVRLLTKSSGQGWIQIADTKAQVKGRSDTYFVVGLSESQQQIRCIPCKGAKFPSTVPHPTVTVLPFKLPLCELSSEKGQNEEIFWRHHFLLDTLSHLDILGYEVDTTLAEKTKKTMKESLMKQFALSCRSGHEFRSLEICHMMDSFHSVQLAIKYATQLKRLQLANRLGEVAYIKMEAENQQQEPRVETVNHSRQSNRGTERQKQNEEEEENVEESQEYEASQVESSDLVSFRRSQQTESQTPIAEAVQRRNPFRVGVSTTSSQNECKETRGIHKFDNMKSKTVADKTTTRKDSPKGSGTNKTPNIKGQKQTQLLLNGTKTIEASPTQESPSNPPQKSGVHLWLDANREILKADNADLDDSKIALLGIKTFKSLAKEEREMWISKAKEMTENKEENGKRKRSDKEESDIIGTKRKQSKGETSSTKLKAFAFQK